MKQRINVTLGCGILIAGLVFLSAANDLEVTAESADLHTTELKEEALEILRAKCNVCHRRQNPFMVFNEKNMVKRARKIYYQVFVAKRMPKGDRIQLSETDYDTLKKWLNALNIKS